MAHKITKILFGRRFYLVVQVQSAVCSIFRSKIFLALKFLFSVFFIFVTNLLCAYAKPETDLTLVGAARYIDHDSVFYIGGLYVGEVNLDRYALLADESAKRMQLVITKKKWTKRSWKRYWRERIAANNQNPLTDQGTLSALNEFSGLVRSELLRGDELVVDYVKGKTQIYLNGELAITRLGADVFNSIALTWLGEVPPSLEFQNNILDGSRSQFWSEDAALLGRYKHPENRSKVYSQWRTQEKRSADVRTLAEKSSEPGQAQKQAQEVSKREFELRRKREAQARAKRAREAERKRAEQALSQQKRREAQERREAEEYYLQYLQWQLQKAVNLSVSYPTWAKNFGEEGLVSVVVTLKKAGQPDFKVEDDSVYQPLISEVLSAISNNVGRLVLPAASTAESWSFPVSYLFSLDGVAQAPLIQPLRPDHLGAEAGNAENSQKLFAEYKLYLIEAVKKQIIAAPAVRVSRARDDISVRVCVNSLGEITRQEFVTEPRQKNLRKSIEESIHKASPFNIYSASLLKVKEVCAVVQHNIR